MTDPICSHCWALEPLLGRFKKQYGHYFNFHTVMGGLLEKWDGFADVSNGIGSPADVAGHGREVGEYSRRPVYGTVWLKIQFESSYPPSRVYKVIQKQDEQLANVFFTKSKGSSFSI